MAVDTDHLTHRQYSIYQFIRAKILGRGYGPTVREIGRQFGIRSPNGVMCHLRALEKKGLITREPNMSRAIQLHADELSDRRSGGALPLKGVIAAGRPIEAVAQNERLDVGAMFDAPNCFVLEVRGDSMIEDQIADGDYVVVRHQEDAADGQIVAAQLDDGEVTLKRLYRESDRVRLEPANCTMKPIYASNARVLGVVVGVVRKYP